MSYDDGYVHNETIPHKEGEMSEKSKTINVHIEVKGACCESLEQAVDNGIIRFWIVSNSLHIMLDGKRIQFCPYCGTTLSVEMPNIIKFAEKSQQVITG